MNHSHSMHQFAEAATAQILGLRSHDCELTLVQEPLSGKVSVGKEKDRKPIDPPPIVQLRISQSSDPHQNYLQSPYFFVTCSLRGHPGTALAGTVVSSLHRLKDLTNKDGAFFVFGDLSVKLEGEFQFRFDLYEMQGQDCAHVGTTLSRNFIVVSSKNFQGMAESTQLTRSFSEQGVRLRLRKEPRTLLKPKGPSADDYMPRHYQKGRTSQASLPSPISPEIQRHGQEDQGDSQGNEVHSSQTQPLKQLSRSYSHHSQQSHESFSPYVEPSAKRPRTGSEHSQPQSFAHQNLQFENPQYQHGEMYSDSQVPVFSPLAQQTSQQTYTYPYVQSPQDTHRGQHFPHGNSLTSASYSGASGNMSPQPFPAQSQALRGQHFEPSPQMQSQQMQQAQRPQIDFPSTGIASISYFPQDTMMPPSEANWSRTAAHTSFQQFAGISGPTERQGYRSYQNLNVSAGTTMGVMLADRTIPGVSAPPPGSMGSQY